MTNQPDTISTNSLAGKVALVTGASRGIGAATARQLAHHGADLIINYRDKARRAEQVAAGIRAIGRRALTVRADLIDPAAMARMFATITTVFGHLDVLVLNASGGLEAGMPATTRCGSTTPPKSAPSTWRCPYCRQADGSSL